MIMAILTIKLSFSVDILNYGINNDRVNGTMQPEAELRVITVCRAILSAAIYIDVQYSVNINGTYFYLQDTYLFLP